MAGNKFVVERMGDDIHVTIPMVSAIVTVMMTMPPHHDPLACDVLSHIAASIEDSDVEENSGETVAEIKAAVAQFQTDHPAVGEPRFHVDEDRYIIGILHPAELWAIYVSLEPLRGVLPGNGAMSQTVDTWIAAGQLVTTVERLTVTPNSGTMQ